MKKLNLKKVELVKVAEFVKVKPVNCIDDSSDDSSDDSMWYK